MATIIPCMSAHTVEITNSFISLSKTIIDGGYLFYGSEQGWNPTPFPSGVGTAYSQGNDVRSLTQLGSTGPVRYGPTPEDTALLQAIWGAALLPTYFFDAAGLRPLLTFVLTTAGFGWMNPYTANWSTQTQISQNTSPVYPIYKYLGRGLGEVQFYGASPTPVSQTTLPIGFGHPGVPGAAIKSTTETEQGTLATPYPVPFPSSPFPPYPTSGLIYAGMLVQFVNFTNEDGLQEVRIIPYQQGRGWLPTNFFANDAGILPYTNSFDMYGDAYWPSIVPAAPPVLDAQIIAPQIAPGVYPGFNNAAVGIVLETTAPKGEAMFGYQTPETPNPIMGAFDFFNPQNCPIAIPLETVEWDGHPAPFTSQTSGSSPLNSSATSWAPWPYYYAYKGREENTDAVPVLTRGVTTAVIGATVNVAIYPAIWEVQGGVPPTGPTTVTVPWIPLFEGEHIEAGSYVYAAVRGYDKNPTLTAPNNDWEPPGWTGTPGQSLYFIPDQGIPLAMAEIVDPNGAGGQNSIPQPALPFYTQSNQGSIIVHPITFDPSLSGRDPLITLPPPLAQPIGVVLETIEGTGTYVVDGGGVPTQECIKKSVNLFNTQILIELRPMYPNYYSLDTNP